MTMMQGLPLTGVPVAANAKKRGELWLSSCLSHIRSMHKLLSSVYDGLESEDMFVDFDDVEIEQGNSTKLTQIFSDHCYKLINLMREPTNGPVELPLSHIMTVLTRCLKLSYPDVVAIPSRTDLILLLPRLHQSCLDTLSQLIVCCGGDLLAQSRLIIDLCLQTLVSSRQMSLEAKCCTRSSAYQSLVLWVKTCGWGRYLSLHSKLLVQELSADTRLDEEDRLSKKTQTLDVHQELSTSKRKRKGQKKKGRKGDDSYLELGAEGDGGSQNERSCEERHELILWAFSLSELMVETLPFSSSQNLMAHIIKTTSDVQRLKLMWPEPYGQGEMRRALYRGLTSCLCSRLDYRCTRNDAVRHYQMVNTALDLMARACQREETEIKVVCSHALHVLRSSANIKGPVIRKALDFEDTSIEDISQLVRDREQMEDNIEALKQKLMSSEMENEQQSWLVSSLRDKIQELQSKVTSLEASRTPGRSKVSWQDDTDVEGEEDDEEEVVNSHEYIAKGKTNLPKLTGEVDEMRVRSNGEHGIPTSKWSQHQMGQPGNKLKSEPFTSKEMPGMDLVASGKDKKRHKKEASPDQEDEEGPCKKLCKCASLDDASPYQDAERLRTDADSWNADKQNTEVEHMLLDFVDAPPDC